MAGRHTASLAQVGGGDPRVVAHPGFREIPKSLFPLSTNEAQREYDTIARALFEAGRLTMAAHRDLSSYAMQFDQVTKNAAEDKPIRAAWFIQMDKARARLGLNEISKPIAAAQEAPVNKFARSGFSSRRR